ncbi:MAG TPA: hypothetical protein VFL83_01665 [Anaeromyxobacter sp.]|nr:hypothetical protein [Anaeromyxobacter sp.]
MAGWVPPKVKSEAKDKQEIQALFRAMDAASRTGDLDAALALVDFPVTMITDDSRGQATGEAWTRERWIEVMKPFYEKPMKDAKVTHKPTIFLLTDSLATVTDLVTIAQGGRSTTARNAMFLARRDGKWRVKVMAEGGWGDMMAAPAASGAAAKESAPPSTGAGSSGAGAPAAPPKTEGDVQTPKEAGSPDRTR